MAVELHVIVETDPYTDVDRPGAGQFESPDVIAASRHLVQALAEAAPPGCGIVVDHAAGGGIDLPRVRQRELGRSRADLGHQWQWGLNTGYPRGLVHSASLLAPLTKHDRYDDQHQVVVTLWDLRAWLDPDALPKAWVTWQRAMLKRAVKHADAFVVPSHALGAALEEIAPVRDRIRVVPVGGSAAFEPRALGAEPEPFAIVVADSPDATTTAVAAALENDLDVAILDCASQADASESLARAGIDASRVQFASPSSEAERAALLHRAAVLVSASEAVVWPWRVAEALQVGVPIVTVPNTIVADLVADAAKIVPFEALAAGIRDAVGAQSRQLSVLGVDRSASFSWRSTAEQIWALHADL